MQQNDNVHVHASTVEISSQAVVDLEFFIDGKIDVTRNTIPLVEEVVTVGASSFSSRGLNQIHTIGVRPREIVLDVKKFDIDCGSATTCAYEGAYVNVFNIEANMQYTITAMYENLQITPTLCSTNVVLGQINTLTFTLTTACTISIEAFVAPQICTAGQRGGGCSACETGKFQENFGSAA